MSWIGYPVWIILAGILLVVGSGYWFKSSAKSHDLNDLNKGVFSDGLKGSLSGIALGIMAIIVGAVLQNFAVATARHNEKYPTPNAEEAFMSIIEIMRQKYRDLEKNELLQNEVFPERERQLCQLLQSGHLLSWTGKFDEVSTPGFGQGIVVKIEVGKNTYMTAALAGNSPFTTTIRNLKNGEGVVFSGKLQHDTGMYGSQCFREHSLTQQGSVIAPNFSLELETLQIEED